MNLGNNIKSLRTTKKMTQEELAELLYVAYNRDEAEVLQLSKALDAQYDALYSTGKDVLLKKQEKLDQEINIAAIDMATDSILKADRQKQIEELDLAISKEEKIRKKANEILDTYQDQLDPRVYQLAKDEVKKTEKKKEVKTEEAPKLEAPKTTTGVTKKKIVKRRKIEATKE